MNQDLEHLRLLTIFHYVAAILLAVFACFPLIHLFLGIFMISGGFNQPGQEAPPAAFGVIFIVGAAVFIFLGWIGAFLIYLTGRYLGERKHYTFCLVVAALSGICLMPLGTILAVFTIVVLMRPSVKELFEAPASPDQKAAASAM
ncbi:hypothetical protein [Acanthopleuribacter pedis]|uniref:Transmembrane protein n=1 Tax=Acanthopleuribacter pedis TaxID=442870 RepID=A0A8J7QNU3_9BACT|nr:hypothetical protein [Acanthopleuribacter pedis]MBO1321400.1 hypothetical protein [Acanthopleuribacter pedis]